MPNRVAKDLNVKLRFERKLYLAIDRIFFDMAKNSTSPLFNPITYQIPVEKALKEHYFRVADFFTGQFRRARLITMDELQEKMFVNDVRLRIEARVRKQSSIITTTSINQLNRVPEIIKKNIKRKGNSPEFRVIYSRLLNSRRTNIAATETQWMAEHSKFLEVAYLVGELGVATKTAARPAKRWDAIGDDKMRSHHSLADSQLQFLTDPFDVNGEQLMYPGDDQLGASGDNIINCRCSTFYDLSKKDLGNALGPVRPDKTPLKNRIFQIGPSGTDVIVGAARLALATQSAALVASAVTYTPFDDILYRLILEAVRRSRAAKKALDSNLITARAGVNDARERARGSKKSKSTTANLDKKTNILHEAIIRARIAANQLVADLKASRQIKARLAERERLHAEVRKILKNDDLDRVEKLEHIGKLEPKKRKGIFSDYRVEVDMEGLYTFLSDPKIRKQIKFILTRKNTRRNVFRKTLLGLEMVGAISTTVRTNLQFLFLYKKTPKVLVKKGFEILTRYKFLPPHLRTQIQAILFAGPGAKNVTRATLQALEKLNFINADLRKKIQFVLVTEKTPRNIITKILKELDEMDVLDSSVRKQLKFILTTRKSAKNLTKKALLLFEHLDGIDPEIRKQIQFILFSEKNTFRKIHRSIIILKSLHDNAPSILTRASRPIVVLKAKRALHKINKFKLKPEVRVSPSGIRVEVPGKYPGGPESTRGLSERRFANWIKTNLSDATGFTAKQRNFMSKLRKITPEEAYNLIEGLKLYESALKRAATKKKKAATIKKNQKAKVRKARSEAAKREAAEEVRVTEAPVLTKNQREAIKTYVQGGEDMEDLLRIQRARFGGVASQVELDPEDFARLARLERRLGQIANNSTVLENTTVHRVIHDVDGSLATKLSSLPDGSDVPVVSFQSTSTSRKVVKEFAEGMMWNATESDMVYFKIHVPKGTKAIHVDELLKKNNMENILFGQKEVILPDSGTMKIISKKVQSDGSLLVEFDFIPVQKRRFHRRPAPISGTKKPGFDEDPPAIPKKPKEKPAYTEDELDLLVRYKETDTDINKMRGMETEGFGIEGPFGFEIDAQDVVAGKKIQKEFGKIFNKSELAEDLTVYRGMLDFDKHVSNALDRLDVGDTVPTIGTQSVSLSREIAEGFLEDINNALHTESGGPWLFKINLPKGTKAIDVDDILKANNKFPNLENNINEMEFLLPPNSKMRIKKITKGENARRGGEIEFDFIPDPKPKPKVSPAPKSSAPTFPITVEDVKDKLRDIGVVSPKEFVVKVKQRKAMIDNPKVFTKDELKLMFDYQEGGNDVTLMLRMQQSRVGIIDVDRLPPLKPLLDIEKRFDKIFDKAEINRDVKTYRAVSDPRGLIADAVEALEPGDIFPNPAIQSTTTSRATADRFKALLSQDDPWIFEYNVKKGSKALPINGVLEARKAKAIFLDEVLINRNTKLKILKIDRKNKTITFDVDPSDIEVTPPNIDKLKVIKAERKAILDWESQSPAFGDMIKMQESRFTGKNLLVGADKIIESVDMEERLLSVLSKTSTSKNMKMYKIVIDKKKRHTKIMEFSRLKNAPITSFQSGYETLEDAVAAKAKFIKANKIEFDDMLVYEIDIPKGSNALVGKGQVLLPNRGRMTLKKRKFLPDDDTTLVKDSQILNFKFIPDKKTNRKANFVTTHRVHPYDRRNKATISHGFLTVKDQEIVADYFSGAKSYKLAEMQRARFQGRNLDDVFKGDKPSGHATVTKYDETRSGIAQSVKEMQQFEIDINKIFDKSRLNGDTTVFRVLSDVDGNIMSNLNKFDIGDSIPVASVQSTTQVRDMLSVFVRATGMKKPIVFKINIPEGSKVIGLNDIMKNQGVNVMSEIILPNEGTMRLVKRTALHIEFDYIPKELAPEIKVEVIGPFLAEGESILSDITAFELGSRVALSVGEAAVFSQILKDFAPVGKAELEIIPIELAERNVVTEQEFYTMLVAGGFNNIASEMLNAA